MLIRKPPNVSKRSKRSVATLFWGEQLKIMAGSSTEPGKRTR